MLKYKLNIKNKKNNIVEVKYDSLYLSPDGTYITGVTYTSYCLSQENYITVVSNETQECLLDATDVICCGYVIYNKTYKVEIFDDFNVVGILYNDGQYYCVDKDFNKKSVSENDNELSNSFNLVNPFIIIDNKEYEIGKYVNNNIIWYDSIKIPTKYWAYDNKIIIDNVTYDVIIDNKIKLDNNENYYPYIILNDSNIDDSERVLYVIDWEYSKRHNVTIFTIYSKQNDKLYIEKANCVDKFAYYNDKLIDGTNTKIFLENYAVEDDFWNECINKNQAPEYEWRIVKESNMIDLYLIGNTNNILLNSIIYVKPLSNSNITLKNSLETNDDKIVFSYYGKKYICEKNEDNEKKYVVIQDIEYEIFSVDNNESNKNYFIIFNNMPLSIIFNDDNTISMDSVYDNNKFNVVTHYFIKINGKKYKIINNNDHYEITLDFIPTLCLQINYFIGNNILRCKPLDNENLQSLLSTISNSHDIFSFEINCPIFDISLVKPYTIENKDYISSNITLLSNHTSFTIPIKLEKDNALNLHKDFLINQSYVNETTSGIINRIVDMEKDIYYPVRLEEKKGEDTFTLCNKIQIDLHFRSRDLDTWVINDENDRSKHGNETKTNWNLFDYYRYQADNSIINSLKPILFLKDDLKYFPPSDLLYFLNFTDEDVKYQKQKIGKSFLRLSFYDSMDPNKQSLLYTSTIFMSETSLYQKFINSDRVLTNYITLRERGVVKEKNIITNNDTNNVNTSISHISDDFYDVKHIGVHTEPFDIDNKRLTFNEEKRLSSSFIIKNRYESIDSSDGFYLYLFKEYSNWLHERTIYMRVQFNHAGLGKTVNFMILYHKNSNGDKSMINWSSKFNFERYKEGCTLSELYEHIYIEIKVKYDLQNKRFCYYLPKWMSEKNSNKNVMHLSLFEIKIKDESNP